VGGSICSWNNNSLTVNYSKSPPLGQYMHGFMWYRLYLSTSLVTASYGQIVSKIKLTLVQFLGSR